VGAVSQPDKPGDALVVQSSTAPFAAGWPPRRCVRCVRALASKRPIWLVKAACMSFACLRSNDALPYTNQGRHPGNPEW